MLDTEVDCHSQTLEAFVSGNLAANLLDRFLADVLGAALHLAGTAYLRVGSGAVLFFCIVGSTSLDLRQLGSYFAVNTCCELAPQWISL